MRPHMHISIIIDTSVVSFMLVTMMPLLLSSVAGI